MDVKYWWHRLWHWHNSFTKNDVTVYACAPRIWWRPWYINTDRIHVGIKRTSSPWVTEVDMNQEEFMALIKMTNPVDMLLFVDQIRKEEGDDRIQQEGE